MPPEAERETAPDKAMVLAAGLGKRMRPITDRMPKPLVEIAGRTLLDRGLDMLEAAGVGTAVVNVHYLADQIVRHAAMRSTPRLIVSDERAQLLDSGGGIVKALAYFDHDPFYILNADTFWLDGEESDLSRLAAGWESDRMDILLMLAEPTRATGHSGSTDFRRDGEGRLTRAKDDPDGLIYAGAGIVHPRVFAGAKPEPHSLNLYFDRAIAAGRLFGVAMKGHWVTVGTPDAIEPAEAAVASWAQPPR